LVPEVWDAWLQPSDEELLRRVLIGGILNMRHFHLPFYSCLTPSP
jgi:hypothetical protein